jgi:hypothetical protein
LEGLGLFVFVQGKLKCCGKMQILVLLCQKFQKLALKSDIKEVKSVEFDNFVCAMSENFNNNRKGDIKQDEECKI